MDSLIPWSLIYVSGCLIVTYISYTYGIFNVPFFQLVLLFPLPSYGWDSMTLIAAQSAAGLYTIFSSSPYLTVNLRNPVQSGHLEE